ncbi:MAG: type II toxin-antitoxin system prevent-host-death family antitoxin [Lentisphaerota bacterium]
MGIFEAKTKLSEICEEVAKTHVPVVITRRGTALVTIEPITTQPATIRERRAVYMRKHGGEKKDAEDFQPATRSRERTDFQLEE